MKRLLAVIMATVHAALPAAPLLAKQSHMAAPVKKAILVAAKHYIASVACAVGEPEALAELEPYRDDPAQIGRGRFAVVWHGDIGCNGGSASSTANIAIVEVRDGGTFLVDPARSSPIIGVDLTMQRFDRLIQASADTIVLEGRELGPDDALCCASDRWRVTLRDDGRGNWKAVQRQHVAVSKH
jgi:hypothetical protein